MVLSSRAALLAAVVSLGAVGAAGQGSGGAPARPKPHPPASAPTAARDSVGINEFLWYAASTQTVHVMLNASVGSNNGGMNFNGSSSGSATITVPVGWRMRMHFKNLDAIPHSAIVIANQQPLPTIPQTAAFGGAYTIDLTGGLFTDRTDDLNFKAAPAGRYILMCGVPGHGPSGMWIWFVVSADAKAPAYSM